MFSMQLLNMLFYLLQDLKIFKQKFSKEIFKQGYELANSVFSLNVFFFFPLLVDFFPMICFYSPVRLQFMYLNFTVYDVIYI